MTYAKRLIKTTIYTQLITCQKLFYVQFSFLTSFYQPPLLNNRLFTHFRQIFIHAYKTKNLFTFVTHAYLDWMALVRVHTRPFLARCARAPGRRFFAASRSVRCVDMTPCGNRVGCQSPFRRRWCRVFFGWSE